MNIPATLALSAALACATVQASAQDLRSSWRSISYHKADVRGLEIFYRQAGATGFGNSSALPPSDFTYTFDNIAAVIGELTTKLGLTDYVLFVQDYGGPVGFRMALAHPERVRGIIVQNAVSHEQGLSPLWNARRKYWADPAHELEALKANFISAPVRVPSATTPTPGSTNTRF
jgi:pimeloyl-ACP methyl ester carboxylesterase